jgi:hypothetical protein
MLVDALIARINLKFPNRFSPKVVPLGTFEEVGFNYRRIEWISTRPRVHAADW